MKKVLSVCIVLLVACVSTYAQHTLSISIRDKESKEPLAGATVEIRSLKRSAVADSTGLAVITNLATGKYSLHFSFIGFEEQEAMISVPGQDQLFEVLLHKAEEEHEEEVVVQATRSARPFRDIPTRVETISGEELAEKANMKPGEIRMLLSESTGIQTQQTSATSYNSSIRIQGLDGRYTQILKDGFPLYAGFSGGLSLMQLVPLDLKQVEVIKGSSSTLYGGGAIAGLVNLVSKTPTEKRDLSFLANATSAGGLDLSAFYGQRFNKIGVTVFGSRNTGRPYDPADIGLTAIPEFQRYTINPRIFYYGDRTTANFGVSYITEDRVGGSMDYIKNDVSGYYEKNNTDRFTSQLAVTHRLSDNGSLNFKNSYSHFNRSIRVPGYTFMGTQKSTYSELTYSAGAEKMDWIIGANVLTDQFDEDRQSTPVLRNYDYTTFGGFIQNTWRPGDAFSLETGLRGDYVKQYGFELLPRVSAMWKLTSQLTARIGGGFGYKTPTVFNEEAERIQFQGILPINESTARNERSVGGNLDVNYRTHLGEVELVINQMFFYTQLNRPLVLADKGQGEQEFVNANGRLDTRGLETNLRFRYEDLKLFIGYTFADVNTHYDGTKAWFPLTARHRLNNVLMYEKEENFKFGLEAYYVSPQRLNDGTTGRSYWTAGIMGEKIWEKFSIFLNLENFTNTRQTKFGPIYTGPIDNPVFNDIYAPLEGRVLNGGIKLRL
ncbi:TonB-dependent receptor [Flavihumibacter solisilvae]|uniref:Collagen-binding protein n=1 Tax=Flavihumibacter solisilvae TaxID=1349421 RepID=A0A0C1IHL1_9BACT|nr:TonB-dependent receptor [Flavihumibacter solisilvae]KIC93695.1 collagen-binding protein [Flavihumibacter solisilvae]